MTIVAVVLYVLGGVMMVLWAYDCGKNVVCLRMALCVLGWPIVILSAFISTAYDALAGRLE